MGLFDALAILWRRRWWIVGATVAPMVVAAAVIVGAPRHHIAVAVAVSSEDVVRRVEGLVAWEAMPDDLLSPDIHVRIEVRGGLIRVSLEGLEAPAVNIALARVLAWAETQAVAQSSTRARIEQQAADARANERARAAKLRTAWTRELADLESALPTAPPALIGYWTARALMLRGQLTEGQRADISSIPSPRAVDAETFNVVRIWAAASRPKAWQRELTAAALAGFVLLGVLGAWILEWWERELTARADAVDIVNSHM